MPLASLRSRRYFAMSLGANDDEWNALAAQMLHWHHAEIHAWLTNVRGEWRGWSASDAATLRLAVWQPWIATVDTRRAPFVRWFPDAQTNAAFNELDRHALLVRSPATLPAAQAMHAPRSAGAPAHPRVR